MERVVFACVHNAGRSQMAAAWFNRLADPEKATAISAGTQPSPHVHPVVVEAMREKDIDLSKAEPQKLTLELAQGAAFLVTMGCGESCPRVPGVPILDWPLPDPKGQGIEPVRAIRDGVEARVRAFVKENGWASSARVGAVTHRTPSTRAGDSSRGSRQFREPKEPS